MPELRAAKFHPAPPGNSRTRGRPMIILPEAGRLQQNCCLIIDMIQWE